jgi:hypothetical protein
MAQVFPLENSAALFGYECLAEDGTRLGRGLLCRLQLHRPEENVVFPAQLADKRNDPPVLLYDDPADTLDKLIFGPESTPVRELRRASHLERLFSVRDLQSINIVTTELLQKRCILVAGERAWASALEHSARSTSLPRFESKTHTTPIQPQPRRPEDATVALLINAEGSNFGIHARHRVVTSLPEFSAQRFIDQARLFFHIEHLPAAITPERIGYLLTHGNELGPAMVALIGGAAYLWKARTDVLTAIYGEKVDVTADVRLLEMLLQRTLRLEIGTTSVVDDFAGAIDASRRGAPLAFCLNPPTLPQIQHSALHWQPLPANTFGIEPLPSEELLRDAI